uniref:Fatty acid desaturase domain-containing protein n=1 Tax=Chromera velia CCMP2878 TaxID=1169474 RepID=A0A0G4I5Q9_9ALVE|eukprot:Cvel_1863.t1-p1 / transcript=Cvel_1863.t1 / gene=Cvel_1863 / organism=Chromera_velia_CCMP2878 / gene_product=Delta-9 acyl-lipid desaturase 1, putative / transcript_product=Delta-9 acyl-lipid desaturase 1, putative / location=Cvel_scaffold69:49977-51282(-) / protein_length=375 / sequence_SO=supercontig / SO=protein_coding / is_pseudo=false
MSVEKTSLVEGPPNDVPQSPVSTDTDVSDTFAADPSREGGEDEGRDTFVQPAVVGLSGEKATADKSSTSGRKRKDEINLNTPFDIACRWIFSTPVVSWPTTLALSLLCKDPIQPSWMLAMQVLIWLKVGIGMSLLLHRFFSHQSFTAGRVTTFIFAVIACLAGQRSPLWWVSKHRKHHRYPDTEKDPHSPVVMGFLRAFFLWLSEDEGIRTEIEFVPSSLLTPELILVERFFWVPNLVEYLIWYSLFGYAWMLKVGVWSTILGSASSLFFNVEFHQSPVYRAVVGNSSNASVFSQIRLVLAALVAIAPLAWVNPVHLFGLCATVLVMCVGEHQHEEHHKHPTLAKRAGFDPLAVLLLPPLRSLGVVDWAASNWKP